MQTGIKVGDAMTNEPFTIGPEASVIECARLMSEKGVGSVLIKGSELLLGIVTEQDLVRKTLAVGLNAPETPVRAIMEKKLFTITPDKDIYDALILMKKYDIRHLPVMNGGVLVGYITSKDILKIQPHLFESLADIIELREEERKLRLRNG